jgi:hypothetical protein
MNRVAGSGMQLLDWLERGSSDPRSKQHEGGVMKRSEPFPNRAAKCSEPQSGENRRGGENPRGRNVMCSGWSRHTEGRWQHRPGVNAQGSIGRRENAGETQERRIRRLIQGGSRRAEGDAKPMEDALGDVLCMHQRASQAQENPEDPRGDAKRSRGEQQSPTSCYCV